MSGVERVKVYKINYYEISLGNDSRFIHNIF